jgi:O-antigen/teichoic acid export membrane protein
LAASTTGVARAVAVGGQLMLVPFMLDGLGAERYGAWAALSAALALAPGLDLGAGFALLAHVSRGVGRNDTLAQRRAIAAALQLLWGLIPFFGLSLLSVVWYRQGGDATPLSEPWSAGALGAALTIVALPISISPRVCIALRHGAAAGLFALLGSLATLGGSILSLRAGWGLRGLAVATVGGMVLANVGCAVHLFGWRHPELRPTLRADLAVERRALGRDMAFFSVLYASNWAGSTGDALLVQMDLGNQAAAQFAVVQQWMLLPAQAATLFVQPLSAAFAEAWGRNDITWCRSTLQRVAPVAALSAVLAGLGVAGLSRALIPSWSHGALRADTPLLLGLVVSGTFVTAGAVASAFLNAVGMLKAQVWMACALIPTSLAAKWLAMEHTGITGIGWAYALCYFACVGVPYARSIPGILAARERELA